MSADAPTVGEILVAYHPLKAEVVRLRAEVDRLTPVVEAAKAWRASMTLPDSSASDAFEALRYLRFVVDALATSDQPATRPERLGVSSTEQHPTQLARDLRSAAFVVHDAARACTASEPATRASLLALAARLNAHAAASVGVVGVQGTTPTAAEEDAT